MPRKFSKLTDQELHTGIESHILDVFLKLVYLQGLNAATLMRVAKKAKVSFGTVRNYFAAPKPSMEEAAMKAIMVNANHFANNFLNLKREKKPFHPIHTYIDMNYQWRKQHPHHASYLIYYYYRSTTANAPQPNANLYLKAAWIRIEALINESIGLGLYQRVKNASDLSKEIHSLLLGKWITDSILNLNNPIDIELACYRVDELILSHCAR